MDQQVPASYRRLASVQLQGIAGFDAMDVATLERWVQQGDISSYRRDRIICRQGEPSPGLQLLVEGVALVGRRIGDDEGFVFGFLGPGDIWGVAPLIDGGYEALDIVAHEDAIVLTLPRALLARSIDEDPRLVHALALQLAHRLRLLYERLISASTLPVSARLLRHIEAMARTFGKRGAEGTVISLRVSQTLLSQLLKASRQRVNEELRKLQQQGLIRVARETIIVLDKFPFSENSDLAASATRPRDWRR